MFKASFKQMKDIISDFLNKVAFKKRYYLPLIFISFVSYGFSLFNRTVSIDDLAQDLYYGAGDLKIKGLRWGQVLINRIFSTINFTPFINRFLGVLFLIISAVLVCSILYYLDNKKDKTFKYTVFSSVFISYPLINEFFEYYEALTIPLEFAIVSLCILYLLVNKGYSLRNTVLIGIVMSVIMAGYESLIFVYIMLVFVILFHEYVINENKKGWIKEGFRYALPLFIALILKFVIGYGLLFITGLEYEMDGASSIGWFNDFKGSLMQLFFNAWYYGVRALSYFPIGVFVVALIIFVVLWLRKKGNYFIGFFILISMFGLAIMQGSHFGYRMAQTVHLFTAYSFFLLLNEVNGKRLSALLCVLLMFMSYRQAVYLHELLALNNQRSDNETALVQNIGYRLYSEFDLSKEVVFTGEYNLGSTIDSQIYVADDSIAGIIELKLREAAGLTDEKYDIPIVSTNVSSLFNWLIDSVFPEKIEDLFSYYGFDIIVGNKNDQLFKDEMHKLALASNMKSLEIREFDDFILVYLG